MATEWGQSVWINTSILFGVFIFVLLANFAMRNQLHTLNAIKEEIVRKEKKIKADYAKVKDITDDTFKKLRSRLRWQRLAFWSVQFLLAVGFFGAVAMYFAMTPPAWEKAATLTGFNTKTSDRQKTPKTLPTPPKTWEIRKTR